MVVASEPAPRSVGQSRRRCACSSTAPQAPVPAELVDRPGRGRPGRPRWCPPSRAGRPGAPAREYCRPADGGMTPENGAAAGAGEVGGARRHRQSAATAGSRTATSRSGSWSTARLGLGPGPGAAGSGAVRGVPVPMAREVAATAATTHGGAAPRETAVRRRRSRSPSRRTSSAGEPDGRVLPRRREVKRSDMSVSRLVRRGQGVLERGPAAVQAGLHGALGRARLGGDHLGHRQADQVVQHDGLALGAAGSGGAPARSAGGPRWAEPGHRLTALTQQVPGAGLIRLRRQRDTATRRATVSPHPGLGIGSIDPTRPHSSPRHGRTPPGRSPVPRPGRPSSRTPGAPPPTARRPVEVVELGCLHGAHPSLVPR